MKNFLSSNSKLRKSGIFSFGIPAYKAADGFRTCPFAGSCLKGCYARQGFYVMPSVARAQEARLLLARGSTKAFIETIESEIRRRGVKRLRIHDSGDFFSLPYFLAWTIIARRNPEVTFYAYTKAVVMVKRFHDSTISNFKITFSEGGTQDHVIDSKREAHSRVFPSIAALKRAGYSNASKNDIPALRGDLRVGLVYHGHKSRAWSTDVSQ